MISMAERGADLQVVLDIGSYHGQFGDMIHEVWSTATVISIEANPKHQSINPSQITALLSNQAGVWVEFFTPINNIPATGASYKKELTQYYQNCQTTPVQTTTLDLLYRQHKWPTTWSTAGLVKLDTQGSELEILQGSSQFLLEQQPRWILLEASHQPYNQDAPSATQVVCFLNQLGYKWIDVWGHLRLSNHALLQTDLLFEREPA